MDDSFLEMLAGALLFVALLAVAYIFLLVT